MKHDEWLEKTNLCDIAKELGYDCHETLPADLSLHIQHRLAEEWITYKQSELIH